MNRRRSESKKYPKSRYKARRQKIKKEGGKKIKFFSNYNRS